MLSHDREDEPPVGNLEDVLRMQLEANQELLLAALRASEQVDDLQDANLRAEEEVRALKSLEQVLRTTAEFRERLIGIISHDLRTPLNTVLMAGGLLSSRGALTEMDALLVGRIVSSARRMNRMIGQLADFTRVRLGGGFSLRLAHADIGEICRDIAEELRIVSSVTLHRTVHGNLCGAWDADRLAQALSNIASNAVDHAAPGTPVYIEARADGADVVVDITNTGPCIPPHLLPTIFSAFRRAEADAGTRSGHLGLGLFVACEITRAHGGTLDVRSADGTTTFTMRLPRTRSSS